MEGVDFAYTLTWEVVELESNSTGLKDNSSMILSSEENESFTVFIRNYSLSDYSYYQYYDDYLGWVYKLLSQDCKWSIQLFSCINTKKS